MKLLHAHNPVLRVSVTTDKKKCTILYTSTNNYDFKNLSNYDTPLGINFTNDL
jgi:PSP1 C-terminal conserved region.